MAEIYYQKISGADVEPAKVRVAEAALTRARADLRLPPIKIRWVREISKASFNFQSCLAEFSRLAESLRGAAAGRAGLAPAARPVFIDGTGGFRGKVHPFGMDLGAGRGWREPEIYVDAGQEISEIPLTVYHETKHLSDFRSGLFDHRTPAGVREMEKSANRYAERMARGAL